MYKLSAAAAQDVEALLTQSLNDFGLDQTERYYQSLQDCLRLLGDNPQLGVSIDDIRQGYRRFPHQSHLVYYRIQPEHIGIVRILHKRMDATKSMDEIVQDGE